MRDPASPRRDHQNGVREPSVTSAEIEADPPRGREIPEVVGSGTTEERVAAASAHQNVIAVTLISRLFRCCRVNVGIVQPIRFSMPIRNESPLPCTGSSDKSHHRRSAGVG